MISYNATPVHELRYPMLEKAGVRLLVKREDLNHPSISGNKWWKLKYNLIEAASTSHKQILTFGGTYSNHIYATAAAAQEMGLSSVGIIRGEEIKPINKTLLFARQHKMKLHFVSRDQYRLKNDPLFIDELRKTYGDFSLIPEGGTNLLALKGCVELANELQKLNFDYLCLPVGTGGTIAGLVAGFKGNRNIIGVPVLKHMHLRVEIEALIEQFCGVSYDNWKVLESYHHGGYGKVTKELMDFIVMMNQKWNLPLDQVYTGKLLWAIFKEIELGSFEKNSTILALHTGGLQGSIINT